MKVLVVGRDPLSLNFGHAIGCFCDGGKGWPRCGDVYDRVNWNVDLEIRSMVRNEAVEMGLDNEF